MEDVIRLTWKTDRIWDSDKAGVEDVCVGYDPVWRGVKSW